MVLAVNSLTELQTDQKVALICMCLICGVITRVCELHTGLEATGDDLRGNTCTKISQTERIIIS